MSKLLKEFKEFALRGNVVDMAVGVTIGAAFGKVVTAVIDIFLTPILDALPKIEGTNSTGIVGSLISFLSAKRTFPIYLLASSTVPTPSRERRSMFLCVLVPVTFTGMAPVPSV